MSVQELATVLHHSMPIKIILINNSGYSMIRQTQDQWFNSEYIASSKTGGISFPDFSTLSEAFALNYVRIENTSNILDGIKEILNNDGAVLCEVLVPKEARVIPQVKFGRPNEDMEPLLSRNIFLSEMKIPPNDGSGHV